MADPVPQAKPPTHPPTQIQKTFPEEKNANWNKDRKIERPILGIQISFCPHTRPPIHPTVLSKHNPGWVSATPTRVRVECWSHYR